MSSDEETAAGCIAVLILGFLIIFRLALFVFGVWVIYEIVSWLVHQ